MYRKTDKGIIREYMKEWKCPAGESVTIKIYTSTTAGDPTTGTAKTFNYNVIKDFAIIRNIEQQDVVYSGGIYQLGDIKAQMTRELKPIDDVAQTPGDRIIWRGNEYRQVGKIATNYLESYVIYDYVFRRI